jgi:hypothetical protein
MAHIISVRVLLYCLTLGIAIPHLAASAYAVELRKTALVETFTHSEGVVCILEGLLAKGDSSRVIDFVGRRKSWEEIPTGASNEDGSPHCAIVYLNSRGGDFNEALIIMSHFFENMIATHVANGSECLSACAIIWLGGAEPGGHGLNNPHAYRRLAQNARLGFHAPYPVLPEANYSNKDVEAAFLASFQVSQDLLTLFSDRNIPLWCAKNLLHPNKSEFFMIDTVESANLIGARVVIEPHFINSLNKTQLFGICYNLSKWGKKLSVRDKIISFSDNEPRVSSFGEYQVYISDSIITNISHKYWGGLGEFMTPYYYKSEDTRKLVDLMENLMSHVPSSLADGGAGGLGKGFRYIAGKLGNRRAFVSPSFLRLSDIDYSTAYLMPSPGVVGSEDENIRDRDEWCLIGLGIDYETNAPGIRALHGTEFSVHGPANLPPALLGLPASTPLWQLEATLLSIRNQTEPIAIEQE